MLPHPHHPQRLRVQPSVPRRGQGHTHRLYQEGWKQPDIAESEGRTCTDQPWDLCMFRNVLSLRFWSWGYDCSVGLYESKAVRGRVTKAAATTTARDGLALRIFRRRACCGGVTSPTPYMTPGHRKGLTHWVASAHYDHLVERQPRLAGPAFWRPSPRLWGSTVALGLTMSLSPCCRTRRGPSRKLTMPPPLGGWGILTILRLPGVPLPKHALHLGFGKVLLEPWLAGSHCPRHKEPRQSWELACTQRAPQMGRRP